MTGKYVITRNPPGALSFIYYKTIGGLAWGASIELASKFESWDEARRFLNASYAGSSLDVPVYNHKTSDLIIITLEEAIIIDIMDL